MNELFAGVKLNARGFARVQNISHAFTSLLAVVEAVVPPGRQLNIVASKLEEACFYAKKGISLQPEYQDNEKCGW